MDGRHGFRTVPLEPVPERSFEDRLRHLSLGTSTLELEIQVAQLRALERIADVLEETADLGG